MANIREIKRTDGTLITVNLDDYTLSSDQVSVSLTPIQWEIFEILCANSPRIVTRDEMIEKIWSTREQWKTRTVDVHVSSLRKRVAAIRGVRIDSVYGRGYKLVFLNRH